MVKVLSRSFPVVQLARPICRGGGEAHGRTGGRVHVAEERRKAAMLKAVSHDIGENVPRSNMPGFSCLLGLYLY